MTQAASGKFNYALLATLKIIGAALVIWFFVLEQYDLIFNVALWTYLWSLILFHLPEKIPRLEWLRSTPKIRNLMAVAISVSFGTSALISGDWKETFSLPHFYIWKIHLHHLEWSSLLILILRYPEIKIVFGKETPEAKVKLYRKFAEREFWTGTIIIILFALSWFETAIFPNLASLRLISGTLGGSSLFFSWYLKSNAAKSPRFDLVMGCLFAILLGVALQGGWSYFHSWPDSAKHFLN